MIEDLLSVMSLTVFRMTDDRKPMSIIKYTKDEVIVKSEEGELITYDLTESINSDNFDKTHYLFKHENPYRVVGVTHQYGLIELVNVFSVSGTTLRFKLDPIGSNGDVALKLLIGDKYRPTSYLKDKFRKYLFQKLEETGYSHQPDELRQTVDHQFDLFVKALKSYFEQIYIKVHDK